MHIHCLQNKCITLILRNLSLQELIALRPVCTRWMTLIDALCGSTKTLTIFGSYRATLGDYKAELTRFDMNGDVNLRIGHGNSGDHQHGTVTISSSHLDTESIRALGQLFARVQHLVIYMGAVHAPRAYLDNLSLCALLEQWPHLVSLSLFGAIAPVDKNSAFRIASAINSLSKLRRLDILLTNLNPLPIARLTPALSRLEHLSLFAYPGDIALALTRLGPSIQHLRFDYIFVLKMHFVVDELGPSLVINPLLMNITHLRLAKVASAQIVPFICGHFACLKSLDITFDITAKVKIDAHLCMNLKWLVHLHELRFHNIYVDMDEIKKEFKLFQSILPIKILNLAQVKCVGKLDAKLFYHLLERTFPNVEQIYVEF